MSSRGILGNMFDGNRDGKLDAWERAVEMAFLDDLEEEFEEEKRQREAEIEMDDSMYLEEVNLDELEYIDEEELYVPDYYPESDVEPIPLSNKAEAVSYEIPTDIAEQLEKMKEIDIVVSSSEASWEEAVYNFKKVGDMITNQAKKGEELKNLVAAILENNTGNHKAFVEREVYTYILMVCQRLVAEGRKMFLNYDGFQELFDKGHWHVTQGRMDGKYFIEELPKADRGYNMLASAQGFWASSLKMMLNEEVVFYNDEYIELTKQLAIAFNAYFSASVKRKKDFFHHHTEQNIVSEWKLYTDILKGLPIDVIESLDESGWNDAVYYQERFHDNGKFRKDFLKNRNKSRKELREFQVDVRNKQHWDEHPEEYKQFVANNSKINKMRIRFNDLNTDISVWKKEKTELIGEINKNKFNLEELNYKRLSLQKKIFGKKKAEEDLQTVIAELTKVVHDTQILELKMHEKDSLIAKAELEKADLKEQADMLKAENVSLRNLK